MNSSLQESVPTVEEAYNNFRKKFLTYLPASSEEILYKAFQFANDLHADQVRKSGEPYILHPLAVAEILTNYRMDETSLVAAILHDVVEDTHATEKEVDEKFGPQAAALVGGLTKISRVQFRSAQEKMAENFRKMIIAMSKDIRVIIIKIADRLHNIRTLKALPREKRIRIAEETLEIYAPLSGRLGMYRAKAELEDMCLRELKPSVYYNLSERINEKKGSRDKIIESAKEHISKKLKDIRVKGQVFGRAKHFYSIYKKMAEKKIEFSDIYDLFAIRIIVETKNECYEALGIIHNIYRPVPGRFKDFIAMPKANLYQSLHTTVVAAKGELLEIQIRTKKMHEIAENGIAAHWAYKEKRSHPTTKSTDTDYSHFSWLKQMVSHEKELSDPAEFLEAVKVDLFDEEVYVFSPKGDVYELRKGATSLDFAFEVHTDIGLRTTGAKINGRMAPLRTRLFSGDVVEILVGNKLRVNKDWLNFVHSSRARSKIRAHLRSEERNAAKQVGEQILEEALALSHLSIAKLTKAGAFQNVNKLFSVSSYEDLILQLGHGKLDVRAVITKILQSFPTLKCETPPETQPENIGMEPFGGKRNTKRGRTLVARDNYVKVEGMSGILIRLARCCEPLPGQSITGFVTRGRGVTIHTTQCPWIFSNDPSRRVHCDWNLGTQSTHSVRLRISAHDQPGVLASLTKLISAASINIRGLECLTNPHMRATILLKLELKDINQLKDILQKIEGVEGVLHVERAIA